MVLRDPQKVPGQQATWLCEIELADTPIESHKKERLSIRTHVSLPLSDHPEAIELAALKRVRTLLDAQIQAMLSP
jgi:hypothetical protein